MNHFLRRFRWAFLTQSRFSRYLLYAFGEIILVVIGILIALQINNWNENRKLKIAEKEFYEGVKSDLQQDKIYIKNVIAIAEKKDSIYKIISINIDTLYTQDRVKLDSLLTLYFGLQRTFYPLSGSYEAAVSSNEINKFKDKNLRLAVTRLYNSTYTRLMDNAQNADDRWFRVTEKHSRIRRTGHIGEMNSEQREEFVDDMFFHVFGIMYYVENLKKAMEEIDSLIAYESKYFEE